MEELHLFIVRWVACGFETGVTDSVMACCTVVTEKLQVQSKQDSEFFFWFLVFASEQS